MKATEYNALLFQTQQAINESIDTCIKCAPEAEVQLDRIGNMAMAACFYMFLGKNGNWDWY